MTETIQAPDQKTWLEVRAKDITSTEISALFGISPWCTEFELWHRKRDGVVVEIEENDRMKWGTRLQDSIAAGIAEDQKWTVRRMDEYMRDPELRIGASFDYSIDGQMPGLLEIKNVDSLIYKQGWIVDGDTLEAPPHIEIQVQHQLAVSGRAFAYIGALIGGNRVALIRREPDQEIIKAIKIKAAAFWKSIEAGIPPSPNFERDAEFIAKLYRYADPGKVYDAKNDNEISTLAKRYKELGDALNSCTTELDAIKAQLLTKIGSAEKVFGENFTITAGLVGPARVEYDRDGYRAFKINWKKTKGAA